LLLAELDAKNLTPWQNLLARPPVYWKGVPLAVAALLSMGVLSWAHQVGMARNAAGANGTPAVALTTAPGQAPAVPGASPQVPAVQHGQPVNIFAPAQKGVKPVLPGAPAPVEQTHPVPAPQPVPQRSGSARVVAPAFVAPPLPAAVSQPPVTPANVMHSMPAPRIDSGAPAPTPVQALPPADSSGMVTTGNSTGGAPINPSGSGANGYIHITRAHIPPAEAPNRPAAAARGDETRAASAARGGQTSAAIGRLSDSIANSDPDQLGYRYQQRATLFLESGDAARAAEDFQSSIGAYTDQIARGDNSAAVKNGLRSARSGLKAALAARRG
jgi:hypothetical protein